jgi:hypothetical protein
MNKLDPGYALVLLVVGIAVCTFVFGLYLGVDIHKSTQAPCTITFSEGVYTLEKPFELPKGCDVRGASKGGTTIQIPRT